ncbi:MAG TPA: protein kinase [Bryobacteraceae bacterium]|nr:protein kinase [Bryobacteraceae bacterium]
MRPEQWRVAEDLFHAALEQSPEDRRAFLDKACGQDTELRCHVELLVSAEENAGSFLNKPGVADPTAALRAAGSLIGQQFGHYRILDLLGVGGMGEVYRAHDTKLGRDVAIKTLPDEFARASDRLAWFRREARTLASLNHPNIGAIYGFEESDTLQYLVLELVEGENLCGPLPIPRALDYARQVAEALEVAHEKGIIHRDLKPANVKVTPEGRVKVLDFGLAKAVWGGEPDIDQSSGATLTCAPSLTGHVVGTPGYMSPEQARGQAADQRTDVWAFGCLLFELLSGKRAFQGANQLETITAVLDREPDWTGLPGRTPGRIRDLLKRCLQKQADGRPASIKQVRVAMERELRGSRWYIAAAVAVTGLAIGSALWQRVPPSISDRADWVQLTRFPDAVSQPALSADGRMLTFVRSPSTFFDLGQIYVKALPDSPPLELTHDNLKKMNPAFSEDGAQIVYTAVDPQFHWDTWSVPVRGGEPRLWMHNTADVVWNGPHRLLFAEMRKNPNLGVVMANENGSGRHDVFFPTHARARVQRPQLSPDGKWVVMIEMGGNGNWQPCRVVPSDGSSAGRQVGPPRGDCSFAAWSRDGKSIYLSSKAGGQFHIWRQRFPDGKPEQITSGPTEEEGVAMSPDGRSLITAVAIGSDAVWVHDSEGERQVSLPEGIAAFCKFTRDGKKLCYRILKAVPRFGTPREPGELWVADLETGRSDRIAPEFEPVDYDISSDSRRVVMEILDGQGKPGLWVAPLDRSAPPDRIPNVEGSSAIFGPAGEIYFQQSDNSATFAYRVLADGTGLKKAIEWPIFALSNVSPDARFLEAWAPRPDGKPSATQLFPLAGGTPIVIGSNTFLQWSHRGDSLWVSGGPIPYSRIYIVPLPTGKLLPRISGDGFHSEQEIASVPGAHWISAPAGAPGPTSEIYAFEKRTIQRNLYRIPIR